MVRVLKVEMARTADGLNELRGGGWAREESTVLLGGGPKHSA